MRPLLDEMLIFAAACLVGTVLGIAVFRSCMKLWEFSQEMTAEDLNELD